MADVKTFAFILTRMIAPMPLLTPRMTNRTTRLSGTTPGTRRSIKDMFSLIELVVCHPVTFDQLPPRTIDTPSIVLDCSRTRGNWVGIPGPI